MTSEIIRVSGNNDNVLAYVFAIEKQFGFDHLFIRIT